MAPETAMKLQDLGTGAGKEKILASMNAVKNGMPAKTGKGKGKGANRRGKGSVPLSARTPLERGQALVTSLLKEANNCRDCAFKLRPIKMSKSLIGQLQACDVKLRELAESVNQKVNAKANTNGAYATMIEKARSFWYR